MIMNDYGIRVKLITKANAILECVHQTIGNMLCTFKIQDIVFDDDNLLDGILASIMFVLRATVHTTTQYTHAN